jgi:hypothetical protein
MREVIASISPMQDIEILVDPLPRATLLDPGGLQE